MKTFTSIEFMKALSLSKHREIELSKEYFVNEWSWQPICDGVFTCKEIIRYVQIFEITCDGGFRYKVPVYQTGKNNRFYFPWEVYSCEEDAKTAINFLNIWAYDYDGKRKELLMWLMTESKTGFEDRSIDGIRF